MSSIIDYTEFPGLEELYLEEDSYILGIKEVATAVIFTVDAVLTPEHPPVPSTWAGRAELLQENHHNIQ